MSFEIIENFKTAMLEAGIEAPDHIIADGVLHRFHVPGQKHGSQNGAYKLHLDGAKPAGYFEDFKTGIKSNWKAEGAAKPLSTQDKEKLDRERRQREAKKRRRENKAKSDLQDFLLTLNKAPQDQPTLIAKQIQAHGMRVGTWKRKFRDADGNYQEISIANSLIVPMYNDKLELASVQAIFPHVVPELGRNKHFWPGLPIAGLFWWIGGKSNQTAILEGVATAASFYEDTGLTSFISFSASNMPAVAKIVRQRLPDHKLIVVADNDENTPGNPGVKAANEAAALVDGVVYVPPICGDYNDYMIEKARLENDRG